MLSNDGQSSTPSPQNLERSATPQYESNLFKNKSNQGQKSALHSFKAPSNPVTSHSEMLPVHPDEALVMVKYTVYWINSKDMGKMYQLAIEWPHVEKVKEAIRDVIPYMNQKIAEDNSNYVLALDPKLYEFYKARKNGKPKYDFPSLDMDETLSMTGIQRLTLVEKSPDAVMLRADPNKAGNNADFKAERMQGPKTEINMNTKLPKVPSIASRRTMDDNEEEFTESMCLCFKIRRRRARQNPIHQVDNLDQKLLQS